MEKSVFNIISGTYFLSDKEGFVPLVNAVQVNNNGSPFQVIQQTPYNKYNLTPNSFGSDIVTPDSEDVTTPNYDDYDLNDYEQYDNTPKRSRRLDWIRSRVQTFSTQCNSLLSDSSQCDNIDEKFSEQLNISHKNWRKSLRNNKTDIAITSDVHNLRAKPIFKTTELEPIMEDKNPQKRGLETPTKTSNKKLKPWSNKRGYSHDDLATPKRIKLSPKKVSPKKLIITRSTPFSNKFIKKVEAFNVSTEKQCKEYLPSHGLDFLSMLGFKNNLSNIVSCILSYLSCSELYSASLVSQNWKMLCYEDRNASRRLKLYLANWNTDKENCVSKVKTSDPSARSDSKTASRKPLLSSLNINNNKQSKNKVVPLSPPVSPGRRKFYLHMKEVEKLNKDEMLLPCPACSSPSRVDTTSAKCTSPKCSLNFCTKCLYKLDKNHQCKFFMPGSPSPTKAKQVSISSKLSRKALRRL